MHQKSYHPMRTLALAWSIAGAAGSATDCAFGVVVIEKASGGLWPVPDSERVAGCPSSHSRT